MNWPWKKQTYEPDKEHEKLRREVRNKVSELHGHLAMLDWNTEDDDGQIEMTLEGLSHEWKQFVDGMNCKIMDVEPYNGGTLVLCEIWKPFRMQKQWHFPVEVTLSLDVTMIDRNSGRKVNPGESIRWNSNEKHTPEFLDTGFIIVVFTPQLKEA